MESVHCDNYVLCGVNSDDTPVARTGGDPRGARGGKQTDAVVPMRLPTATPAVPSALLRQDSQGGAPSATVTDSLFRRLLL